MVQIRSIDAATDIFLSKMQLQFQKRLSQTLSHETMNPLNSIISLSQMMEVRLSNILQCQPQTVVEQNQPTEQNGRKINKETIKWLRDSQVIVWSNSKLLELLTISQLDYMKLQSQESYHYKISEKPLKVEIAEFLLPFRKMIADRQIQLKLKVLPGMNESTRFCLAWRVYKSILYHIVYNAIKFSKNQGKIGIQITYAESE